MILTDKCKSIQFYQITTHTRKQQFQSSHLLFEWISTIAIASRSTSFGKDRAGGDVMTLNMYVDLYNIYTVPTYVKQI